jgi:hypothetical protein
MSHPILPAGDRAKHAAAVQRVRDANDVLRSAQADLDALNRFLRAKRDRLVLIRQAARAARNARRDFERDAQ